MHDLTKAQQARISVQSFKTIAHALALRGFYRPSEKMGQSLAECLANLSPEIYGSMNDSRIVELNGLEYVIDRLPRGIEECTRIILTEEEQFGNSVFEKVEPLKRRRSCYQINNKEMCFAITRGLSEIYDILTHLTFLDIEARKIYKRIKDEAGDKTLEWKELEKTATADAVLEKGTLEQAIWNLSIVLGRSYFETRKSYDYFESNKIKHKSNNGLFSLIYHLGKRIEDEMESKDNAQIIYLTPSLMSVIGHQKYGKNWADDIKAKLHKLGLITRPLHIISANLHSILNLVYGFSAIKADQRGNFNGNIYDLVQLLRNRGNVVLEYAKQNGLYEILDKSGTHIDCQLIDTSYLESMAFYPEINIDPELIKKEKPVLLVMDYAFGTQAFEVMDSLLNPYLSDNNSNLMNVISVSVMGKAGILPGNKGDIMLATAHVIEGSSDNYIFENDLQKSDFNNEIDIYTGPMITVLGTSLQNRDMLERFQASWNTIGLEMEGGHYQRAINAAIIKGHISNKIKVRYAYYASDNPMISGQTLAAGEMGDEGIKPTYMVTKVILEKIFQNNEKEEE
ncbi:Uncharacterized protein dnl_29310 [Desulfonema limicola]|uniref:Uncharacterized protein n=1 Tax=Desulfonema limicola TaxID=45656 RepID=A0A975GGR7_9BACT|nr:hypothetical protein [Desulfonema limicola]QTA80621.1 Uncharacterized protein dnl_29310 [Desulfonema limicola]